MHSDFLGCAIDDLEFITFFIVANLNSDARTPNGPEDAQDYLWLTQDLWMKDDVWNWANNSVDAKNVVLKICSRESCGAKEQQVAEYKRCSACHRVCFFTSYHTPASPFCRRRSPTAAQPARSKIGRSISQVYISI